MTRLVTRDRVWLSGKGQSYVVHPDDNPTVDLAKLENQAVEIEGRGWAVVARVSYLCGGGGPRESRLPVNLIVRPLENT